MHYGKRKRMRRVFLFEQAVIFTKAKKQKAKGDTFVYKNSIKVIDSFVFLSRLLSFTYF